MVIHIRTTKMYTIMMLGKFILIQMVQKVLVANGNSAGLNSQCVAFVDPVAPETDSFLGEWLSFFG